MKKLFLMPLGLAFLASCGNSVDNTALQTPMEDKEDFEEATVSFEDGGATNGEEYFFGVQAEVVEIDVMLREVDNFDEIDASEEEFNIHYDTMLVMIENCKKAMNLYDGKGWPMQQDLEDLTIEWLDAVAGLVNDYLYKLAKPMSVPDDKWKDADFDLYDEYLVALEAYYEVDNRWVDMQYTYAEANGFELSDETIDMDAMIEEDMDKMEN